MMMRELNHSKQRDAIMGYLRSTKSHPTAETIYNRVRSQIPNISLGTVYRNLSLLEEMGMIRKISVSGDPDRFDADTSSHYHFKCHDCGCVSDVFIDTDSLDSLAAASCGCDISRHDIVFFGVCANCKNRSGS